MSLFPWNSELPDNWISSFILIVLSPVSLSVSVLLPVVICSWFPPASAWLRSWGSQLCFSSSSQWCFSLLFLTCGCCWTCLSCWKHSCAVDLFQVLLVSSHYLTYYIRFLIRFLLLEKKGFFLLCISCMCFLCLHPVTVCFLWPCYWRMVFAHCTCILIKPDIHMPTRICMVNINIPAGDCCSLLARQAVEIHLFLFLWHKALDVMNMRGMMAI